MKHTFLSAINTLSVSEQNELSKIAHLPWSDYKQNSSNSSADEICQLKRNAPIHKNVDIGDVSNNNANKTSNNNNEFDANDEQKLIHRNQNSERNDRENENERKFGKTSIPGEKVAFGDEPQVVVVQDKEIREKEKSKNVNQTNKLRKIFNSKEEIITKDEIGTYIIRPRMPKAVTAMLSQLPDLYSERNW